MRWPNLPQAHTVIVDQIYPCLPIALCAKCKSLNESCKSRIVLTTRKAAIMQRLTDAARLMNSAHVLGTI